MKYKINLNQIPNQEGSFNITEPNGTVHRCDFSLRLLTDDSMCITLTIDDDTICQSKKCINKMPLVLNNKIKGNIYFLDIYGNTNPDFSKFNERYYLIYDTDYIL